MTGCLGLSFSTNIVLKNIIMENIESGIMLSKFILFFYKRLFNIYIFSLIKLV